MSGASRLTPLAAAVMVAAGGAAALAAALFFQYRLGYVPCALCLWQRWAYYVGVPLALFLAVPAVTGRARGLVTAGLAVLALAFAANAALGLYHAGIEWGFWPGPPACSSGAVGPSSGNFMQDLQRTRIVPCDAAPWRFAGLSFAGWNMVISAGLAGVAALGARQGSSSVSQ